MEARGHRGLVGTYAGQALSGGYFAVGIHLLSSSSSAYLASCVVHSAVIDCVTNRGRRVGVCCSGGGVLHV
eukprot:7553-Eustigmatos_ZCMA.PRE.1